MPEDILLPFAFPAVPRKKGIAGFDGGRLTTDGGVMLLATAERRPGIADKLAAMICDPRDPNLVTHSVADILRARILAIACGYESLPSGRPLAGPEGASRGELQRSGHPLRGDQHRGRQRRRSALSYI